MDDPAHGGMNMENARKVTGRSGVPEQRACLFAYGVHFSKTCASPTFQLCHLNYDKMQITLVRIRDKPFQKCRKPIKKTGSVYLNEMRGKNVKDAATR